MIGNKTPRVYSKWLRCSHRDSEDTGNPARRDYLRGNVCRHCDEVFDEWDSLPNWGYPDDDPPTDEWGDVINP